MPQRKSNDDDAFMAELSDIMMTPDDENPDMLMLRNMIWEELDKALAELPTEQREAITMTEVQGLSVKEAANAMGVSTGTFLPRYWRALHQRLRLHRSLPRMVGRALVSPQPRYLECYADDGVEQQDLVSTLESHQHHLLFYYNTYVCHCCCGILPWLHTKRHL